MVWGERDNQVDQMKHCHQDPPRDMFASVYVCREAQLVGFSHPFLENSREGTFPFRCGMGGEKGTVRRGDLSYGHLWEHHSFHNPYLFI